MDWFTLALLCAFSLASADALTKKFFPDYSGWELTLVRFTVPALLLTPVMFLLPLPQVPAVFWLWIAGLIPLEILAMWLYLLAIRDSPLHLTLPYLAFTPVFNIATGNVILGETVSTQGLLGILLVVVGAYLLNINHITGKHPSQWLAPFAAITRERGSRLMLAVAAIYSITSVAGKGAMQYATPESFGPFYYVVIGAVVTLIAAARRPAQLRVVIRKPLRTLTVGFLMAVMVVTHFLALAMVEVAYMITVKRTSLLFGIVYGAVLFHERQAGRHLVAGVLMVTGVGLILI
jgi:drug/metabolite transporter (DMT)-like permease